MSLAAEASSSAKKKSSEEPALELKNLTSLVLLWHELCGGTFLFKTVLLG
jgi:hypothetical protein